MTAKSINGFKSIQFLDRSRLNLVQELGRRQHLRQNAIFVTLKIENVL
jgi:hypothetical protein